MSTILLVVAGVIFGVFFGELVANIIIAIRCFFLSWW